MAGFEITVDDAKVRKSLSTLLAGVKDFSEPLESAGNEMLARYGDRVFKNQKPDNGAPWERLSPGTLMMREKRQGHYARTPITTNKILIWTGDLMKGFVKNVEKTKLTIENNVEYFKYHQKSQRKMLFLNDSIKGLVARHLIKYVRGITR